jgi:hypothetical protein
MAAPGLKAVGTAIYTASSSPTIALPGTAAAGDVAFLAVNQAGAGAARTITTPPSGWTKVLDYQPSQGSDEGNALWYRVLTGGEADPQVVFSGSVGAVYGRIVLFQGIDTTQPIAASAFSEKPTDGNGAFVGPSVASVRPYSLQVQFGMVQSTRSWTHATTAPWAQAFRDERSVSPQDANGSATVCTYNRRAAPGTHTAMTMSMVGPSPYPEMYVWSVMLQPPVIHSGGGEAEADGILYMDAQVGDAPVGVQIAFTGEGTMGGLAASVSNDRRGKARREHLWVFGLDGERKGVIV